MSRATAVGHRCPSPSLAKALAPEPLRRGRRYGGECRDGGKEARRTNELAAVGPAPNQKRRVVCTYSRTSESGGRSEQCPALPPDSNADPHLKCSARRLHPHISCRPRPHRSQWVRHAPRRNAAENQQWAAASAQLPRTNPCERAPLNDATASGTPRLGCVRRHVGCTAVQTYQRQPVPRYGHQPCACTASILMPLSCLGGRRADIQYRSSCPCFTFLPLLMELVCRTCKSEDFGYSI